MSSENAPSANGAVVPSDPAPSHSIANEHTAIPSINTSTTASDQTQSQDVADTSKQSKKDRPKPQQSNTEQNIAEAGQGVKLTGAQLKKQKQAEKAARRADKVAIKGEQAQRETAGPSTPNQQHQRRQSQAGTTSQPAKKDPQTPSNHRRQPSAQPPLEPGAVRVPFRPSQQPPASQTPSQSQSQHHAHTEKKPPLLTHLYPTTRLATLTTAPREIHPQVLTLALHLRSLTLAGSSARTLALLLTLKRVIQSYTTPPSTALSRHLTTHLSHQISFLTAARPLGIPQGNAIRWLKKLISQLDPDLDDSDAKKFLCGAVDGFVREKITLAAEVIASQACARIDDVGECILVFGKSSVVERTLIQAAKEEGKRFRVVVVDSRPLFEGRNLARGLVRAGMREGGELEGCEVVYCLIEGVADAIERNGVTKCFLGASGMLGNGGLYGRAGTAMVAMMAKEAKVPVVVLGESLKFTGRMAVDSLGMNEVGDVSGLVEKVESQTFTTVGEVKKEEPAGKKGGGKKSNDDDAVGENDDSDEVSLLSGWREQQNLYLLNLMYDMTPKELIDMVICELGTLPPGAVPVVRGDGGEE